MTYINCFTVVVDGLRALIGLVHFDQLGLALKQSSLQQSIQVNVISPHSSFNFKIALLFPDLKAVIGRSKNHVSKTKFHKYIEPRKQKERRIHFILINLLDKVKTKLEKLRNEQDITKPKNCPDKCFFHQLYSLLKSNNQ